jgi:hypothetical protein
MTPEQAVFDWKRDFVLPVDDETRGEFLKDVAARSQDRMGLYSMVSIRGGQTQS